MTRDELILRTRQLIAEGERLGGAPSLIALQTWLQLSDDLLALAWGSMDRYHLAWLMVGKPKGIVRGRPMTPGEEAAYVREVASQKTAALRMSLDAAERQGMPFRGETGGMGPGQGMGAIPGTADEAGTADEPGTDRASGTDPGSAADAGAEAVRHAHNAQGSRRSIPLDPELAARLEAARRSAAAHPDHAGRRAPRPERLQR
ncbi:MAG TPA: hypothetical protein VES19_15205 [Candidatus Limnocylindrales bacterium]|nr:hypothetical protein [Candidatus Limnocylindrales bacterium]